MIRKANKKTILGWSLLFVLASTSIIAQQSSDGPFVLHEFISDGGEPSNESNVTSPKRDPGSPPPLTMEAGSNEPILDADGPKFDVDVDKPYGELTPFGSPNKLDDRTDRVSELNYFAQFEPSVIPYKRTVSQNHVTLVAGDYMLGVHSGPHRPVALRAPSDGEDRFWGSFLIRANDKRLHPIPSVAPNQKIIKIQTEPAVNVNVFQDDADNFFVQIQSDSLVRMNIQLSVPRSYFNAPFADVEWHMFNANLIPEVPSQAKYIAYKVAQKIGSTKEQRPNKALEMMVAYFRNFDARPFEQKDTDKDLYESIATQQIGVCRHRALAFVITAQALGIPARYVYNEAHAFVEVHWPTIGWRRIDLGGAADELNAAIDDGRSLHDSGPDALPQPDRYLREQQRMRQNFPEGTPVAEGQEGANGNGESNGNNGEVVQNGTNGVQIEEVPPDDRVVTLIDIDEANTSVRRGESILIRLRLATEQGTPLADKPVTIYLGPIGQTSRTGAVSLGFLNTDLQGFMSGNFQIPKDHAIGRWEVFAYFPGDEKHRPAIAD